MTRLGAGRGARGAHHSYGSHMTRIAAKGTSTAGDAVRPGVPALALPEKASLPEATATAVCEVPPALAARNGLIVSFLIA